MKYAGIISTCYTRSINHDKSSKSAQPVNHFDISALPGLGILGVSIRYAYNMKQYLCVLYLLQLDKSLISKIIIVLGKEFIQNKLSGRN